MKYYIISGEASGDLHGSRLMQGLKEADTAAEFRFWGGDLMAAEGGIMVRHYKETAVMGFWEVLMKLRKITRNIKECKQDLLAYRPDVVILIDYPGFNFRIAKFAKRHGIKVFYYIAPKVWAWKEKRVHRLRKYVDKLFIIFPFEVDYFKKWGIEAFYSGNPLTDVVNERLANKPDFNEFVLSNQLHNKPVIAILAGSRTMEIKYILPRILPLVQYYPDYQFVVAGAPAIAPQQYEKHLKGSDIGLVMGKTHELLAVSDAAIVASGTATLEAALIGVPQVVCYGGNELSYQIAKRLIKVKYASLVNLIMNAPVVTELLQHDLTLSNLQRELSAILPEGPQRQTILDSYAALRTLLGKPAAAARIALKMKEELMIFKK
ncbi:MAG: lipid-A-disaccharide synthase [Bacteroidales bacterium]|nr:lipid-A-disaccharide synthase [Bacteroidales bacterium]MCL2133514.1 lipid-A-disaccharide synthase [Bacteroidales bacterium]